ncbi:MAG: redoxin domain-containing protein [Chloroflexi bacterium]|nr:redoxin domain-containing protein [Chloroflexota bacterium]
MCARQNEFNQSNTRVFIISFGTLPAIQQWMKETCNSFDVLLDRDRTVYKAYQLERSRIKSKSLRILWLYFTYWLQGRKFHDSHGDDTSQLGGDFIVDKNRILRLVHPSQDPADRPPVDDLLKVIEKL